MKKLFAAGLMVPALLLPWACGSNSPSPTTPAPPTFTNTYTPTVTNSPTITRTPTATPTRTQTLTPTNTSTPTVTATGTSTATPTVTQTPLCASPSQEGYTPNGANQSSAILGRYAYPVVLGSPTTAISLSMYLSGSSGQIRMGLYTDNGSLPGNLIVESAPQTAVDGLNTLFIPNTPLSAGNYWLAFQIQGGSSFNNDTSLTGYLYTVQTFGPFVSPFAATGGGTGDISIFMNTCP